MPDLAYLSISDAHDLLVSKKVSAAGLTQYYLDRIETYDAKIKACLTVCTEQALKQAKAVDAKIAAGDEIGLLEGIPYTAKDMFCTEGVRTTAASKMLDSFVPAYSATVIEKLNAAGAILLAKTNQDEYAHGGSTENSAYFPTHNPWDLERVPGGSSGGSAAAVAMDFGIFSLGTDTGGSIRQPAAYCGVSGFKPTYGLVSRYGVVAMASSLDVIGPITRSAEDAAIVLEAIAGQDPMDSTTIQIADYEFSQTKQSKIRIGVLETYQDNEAIKQTLKMLAADYEPETFSEKDFADPDQALATYYILTPSEISSNLERYDGIRYTSVAKDANDLVETYSKTRDEFFGPEVKRRNMIGTYALSAGYYDAYYKQAMKVRTLICRSYEKLFEKYDLLITPTTTAPAFKFGAKSDPLEMYKTDILTVLANLAGLPAISIPAGTVDGLPMGLQIMGKQGDDAKVLAFAKAVQAKTDWHTRRPEVRT